MVEILTAGEILVEIMREKAGIGLGRTDIFKGPFASGAPAIFIDTAAMLGHSAGIAGGVGKDDFGEMCISRLSRDGVDTSYIMRSNIPTGVAFVAYFKNGSRKYIFHIRDSAASSTGDVPEADIKKVKIFHVMGCSLMIKEELAAKIIRYASMVKEAGGMVSFDPNIRVELMNMDYIKDAVEKITHLSDIVIPSPKELMLLTASQDESEAIKKILGISKILVLKRGKKGCEIFTRDQVKNIRVPSFKIREIDPTGAGDAFDAGFLCAYLEDRNFYECGILANACGAMNAMKLGPMEGISKKETVNNFIKENRETLSE